MSSSDFPIEKTKYGEQYLIPGTEKRIRPIKKKQFFKLEGNQYCLPGTDPKFRKADSQKAGSQKAGGQKYRRQRNKISLQTDQLTTLDLFSP